MLLESSIICETNKDEANHQVWPGLATAGDSSSPPDLAARSSEEPRSHRSRATASCYSSCSQNRLGMETSQSRGMAHSVLWEILGYRNTTQKINTTVLEGKENDQPQDLSPIFSDMPIIRKLHM